MGKVKTFKEVLAETEKARKKGLTIVASNGCFDILHVGHVRNLERAKALGDVLVVGVNSDASVRMNKGPLRPILPARERAEVIASMKSVDHVFVFGARNPVAWIKKLRPHIQVKGVDAVKHPDYPGQKAALERVGGKYALVPLVKGRSTSSIIDTIVKRHRK